MNCEALGAIGEVAGAVAVIATLLYLAVQVRQSTNAQRVTAVQTAAENSARFSELLAQDETLGALFWRGMVNPEALGLTERQRFMATINMFLRREAVAFHLHQEGLMPESMWQARLTGLKSTLNQPGTRYFLELGGETLPADFRQLLSEILAGESTSSPAMKALLAGEAATPESGLPATSADGHGQALRPR